jgi:hypothetical protein
LIKAHELIAMYAQPGRGYGHNAACMVLGGVLSDFGQSTVDELIRE